MAEQAPTKEEARSMVKAEFGKQISIIDQTLTTVRESGNEDPNIIHLHNACTNLLQLCAMIIGVAIFPEDTVGEAANESSSIITD